MEERELGQSIMFYIKMGEMNKALLKSFCSFHCERMNELNAFDPFFRPLP